MADYILTFGYLAIFLLMVANGIVSLPSSHFIYVTAGFLVPLGELLVFPIVLAGTMGNTVGNIILYEVSRRKGLDYVSRWRWFSKSTITRWHRAFELRGAVIVFIGKFLPGIKVIIPVVAGIGRMTRSWYMAIIWMTSLLWALGLTWFGVYFGSQYADGMFGWYSFGLILLSIVAIYVFHQYVRSLACEPEETVETSQAVSNALTRQTSKTRAS